MLERGGLKAVLYGEVHRLPSGEHEVAPGRIEDVPGDSGVLFGGQVGFFTGERDTFVNLFFRHGRGLAAYGELATPEGTSPERTVEGAHQTLLGISGNYEHEFFAVVAGGYFRTFREPTPEPYRFGNVDEGILVLRPHVFLGDHAGVAVEGSYQAQQRAVLNVATNEPLHAKLWRFGLIPYLSPAGRGVFKRPQLRLIWAVTKRNDDARSLYPTDDVFARRKVEQFFGIGAEWWFNSTSYGN
jgi:maltoporin